MHDVYDTYNYRNMSILLSCITGIRCGSPVNQVLIELYALV